MKVNGRTPSDKKRSYFLPLQIQMLDDQPDVGEGHAQITLLGAGNNVNSFDRQTFPTKYQMILG